MKQFEVKALEMEALDLQEMVSAEGGAIPVWVRFLGPIGEAFALFEITRAAYAYLKGIWDGLTEDEPVVTNRPK